MIERSRSTRRAAGAALGALVVALFLLMLFGSDQWPRKRAARRIRDGERVVVALLPSATVGGGRERLAAAMDCAVRAAWGRAVPEEDALHLADSCFEAARDGALTAAELDAIVERADAICRSASEPSGR